MHNDRNINSRKVAVDVTPVSFQCYDTNNCPAVMALRSDIPSVEVETLQDGSVLAMCPLSTFARAQSAVQLACTGCKARHK